MKNLLLIALAFVAFNLNAQNVTVKAITQSPVCYGATTGSIDLVIDGGSSPYTFLWSNGATTSSISNLAAGSYSVTVNDNGGLTSSTTLILSQPNKLTASGLVINCSANGASDGSITVTTRGGTPDYSFAWDNGATTSNLSNLTAGTYTLIVTDGQGCQASMTKTVQEPLSPTHLSISHGQNHVSGKNPRDLNTGATSNMNVSMYPNPASNFLSVKANEGEETELNMFNGNGQLVSAQKFNNGNTNVDVSNLPHGNYIVQLKSASGITSNNISIVK